MFSEWGNCVQNFDNAENVATLSCISVIFLNILSALLAFAGLTALTMFIMGGYKFMFSKGDAKRLEGARNNFIFGIIGLGIVLFSFVFIRTISIVTGIECIGIIGKFGFGCTP